MLPKPDGTRMTIEEFLKYQADNRTVTGAELRAIQAEVAALSTRLEALERLSARTP